MTATTHHAESCVTVRHNALCTGWAPPASSCCSSDRHVLLLWPPLSSLAAGGVTRMLHRLGMLLYVLWPVLYAILDRRDCVRR